jgi:chitinase
MGPYTRENGFLGYNEICELNWNPRLGWTVLRDAISETPFMFEGNKWVSYDDELSIEKKSEVAAERNLAGVMIW